MKQKQEPRKDGKDRKPKPVRQNHRTYQQRKRLTELYYQDIER